jgi:acyl-CoA reductase-like NAD-dependent aldehyde dehydrogenase
MSLFSPSAPVPLWLGGKEVLAERYFEVRSPLDGKICWTASAASVKDAKAAVDSAERAFQSWKETKPTVRRDIFLRAHGILKADEQECQRITEIETGAPAGQFKMQFETALELCMQMAALCCMIQGSVPCPATTDRKAMVTKEPYGVVLAIAPWNAPHTLGLRACMTPLAAGNTVVLKGPEFAPATFWHFVKALHLAGLPAGALNTIYHRPEEASEVTEALISHPATMKIGFTGSERVGSIIASTSGKYLKPCLLELGGKASAIVCEDADMKLAARECILGAFTHAGQVCMSSERIVVRQEMASEFETILTETAEAIFGEQSPALRSINETSMKRHTSLIEDAVSKGASMIWSNDTTDKALNTRAKPVILGKVRSEMEVYRVETFGPIVTLHVVQSDNEAIALANDTRYGLSSAIFSKDLLRAFRLARRIDAGATHINGMTIHDDPVLPHGGVKSSGWGRHNGMEGLDEWMRTKVVTWKD